MTDKRTSTINRVELELGPETRKFLERLSRPPIGETSVAQKLDAIIAMLQRFGDVPAQLGLAQEELSLIHGIVTNLDGKVEEFMATQEERLRAVKDKLDAIQSGVDKIQSQLADLKANNPELEDEIAAIEATAAAIDTDVNPAAPAPTEPPTT